MQLDKLGIEGFTYADLYDPYRLNDLVRAFDEFYHDSDHDGYIHFESYRRTAGEGKSAPEISAILINAGKSLERFIARLFLIEQEVGVFHTRLDNERMIMRFKADFVKRGTIRKKDKPENPSEERLSELHAWYENLRKSFGNLPEQDEELSMAVIGVNLFEATQGTLSDYIQRIFPESAGNGDELIARSKEAHALMEEYYFLRRTLHPESMAGWMSSRIAAKFDYSSLVKIERPNEKIPEIMKNPGNHYHLRDGFKLTDRRGTIRGAMGEIEYCMICHEREKDSCSNGMKEKDGSYKRNPLGIKLTGCPLDEKISEMHRLKGDGFSIGALAMVTIDNPMCAGTGHRICNDCMKGCIFQKQEPVNIPFVETSVLTDVLCMPWGFEIYSLLSKWNPLKIWRPAPLPFNGKSVLVVGLGPAGYTLSNHLLNEGFAVVGADGLKIEPLDEEITGSESRTPRPIYDYRKKIEKELDERILEGFGGVSEYGITVRWDKNFLTVLHLMLARRTTFKILDGVRFGGTLTAEDAWELGFDHIALATGAGRPTIISMKNNLSRGIRKASDFLMALQLSGAAKKDSLANLQIQLPAIIIGGGLTGVDTTTETIAYYPVQVEKFYERASVLLAEMGEHRYWHMYDEEERGIAEKFFEHGREVKAERERAQAEGRMPDFLSLINAWGGVTLVYRKALQDSPAYRLNHEEVAKALEEGIFIAENLAPVEAKLDKYGAVEALVFERQVKREDGKYVNTGELVEMPAKTVFVAAGTAPNTMYEHEYPGSFAMDDWNQYYRAHEIVGEEVAEPVLA